MSSAPEDTDAKTTDPNTVKTKPDSDAGVSE